MVHLIGTEARCQQPVAGKAQYQISGTASGIMPYNSVFLDGRYIVTWGHGGDIYYRVLDYKGDFSGGQIRLDYRGSESNPVVAADPAGDYLIAFLSTLTDNRNDVYGAMFTYNGIPMPGWEVSKRIDDDQPLDGFDEWLQIAGFSSVGPKFLVTWGDDDEGQQTYTLENAWTKVVTSAYVGHSTIRVDEAQADTASNSPTGAVDGRDQLLLTWSDARTESLQNESSLYFKTLDQSGAVLTPETRLLERRQVDTPAIAVNRTQSAEPDEYVIVWPYRVTNQQTQVAEWRLVYRRFSSTD